MSQHRFTPALRHSGGKSMLAKIRRSVGLAISGGGLVVVLSRVALGYAG